VQEDFQREKEMPIEEYDEERMTRLDFVPTREFAGTIERDRLRHGRSDQARQLGFFTGYGIVDCDGDAAEVNERALQVMSIINEWCLAPEWPSLDDWRRLLPDWFVWACAPERTDEDYEREKEERLALPAGERVPWNRWRKSSLSEFTDCLAPEGRLGPVSPCWIWGESEVRDGRTIAFDIDQMGDPPPGLPPGLRWLFLASGANDVDGDDLGTTNLGPCLDIPVEEALKLEYRRLTDGPIKKDPIAGYFVQVIYVSCEIDPATALDRAQTLMLLIAEHGANDTWPSDEEWLGLLPTWFMKRCGLARSPDQYARDDEGRLLISNPNTDLPAGHDEDMSVFDWLWSMQPSERKWIWREGCVRSADALLIEVDGRVEDPRIRVGTMASGSLDYYKDLEWMMVACGALPEGSPESEVIGKE
jgi:hypothetical protein